MITYEHLIGLTWTHGRQDCYELCRRFYQDNFGVTLRNYARPEDWWNLGLNLYVDNFAKEGFKSIDFTGDNVKVGDIFLSAIMADVANHAAIYIGDGKVLHHLPGRLSAVDNFGGIVRNRMCALVRNDNIVTPAPPKGTYDLLANAPAHIKRRLNVF